MIIFRSVDNVISKMLLYFLAQVKLIVYEKGKVGQGHAIHIIEVKHCIIKLRVDILYFICIERGSVAL